MRRLFSREYLVVFIPALLVVIAAFWLAIGYMKPAPPDSFTISAASKGSPYYELVSRYKEIIAKSKVNVELRESQGSFDNLKALQTPDTDVQAGILQGGITNRADAPGLQSMGRLLTEPVWVFYRGPERLDHLTQLQGKRILIGPEGSGTSFLARKLLEANGITAENSQLISMQLPDYVDAFSNETADAGFLVLGAEARTVQRLLRLPNARLMNMAQADALIQRFPFLSRVVLRQGVVDFGKNVPPEDTALVATRATLLIREDTHPALVNLLAQAIQSVQSQSSLNGAGESRLFPISSDTLIDDDPEFPVSPEARRVYKSGPTFFQRVLPFWIGALLDRAVILILPLIGILLPVVRLAPIIYNWRMRRRILYWYSELKALERDLLPSSTPDSIRGKERELDRIEDGVQRISVPLQYTADLYTLRDHVDFVRRRLTLAKTGGLRHDSQPSFAA